MQPTELVRSWVNAFNRADVDARYRRLLLIAEIPAAGRGPLTDTEAT